MIFDLDGTLVNTLADLSDSMNHALASLGQPTHPSSAIRTFIGDGVYTFASRALGENSQHLVEEVVAAMREHHRRNYLNKSSVYPGIFELIGELRKRGIRLAVLTNKDQTVAQQIVEHFFGSGVFEHVVGAVGKTPVKPDRKAVDGLLEKMGLKSADCRLVGDSGVDVDTAKAAGMRVAGVTWGFRDRAELEGHGADVVVDSPAELLAEIENQRG
ncbi:MAG TPA: HAD family hydrolase [Sedimentisphaerales bacterium]|nr:HAD family hydrolase [Sedimentisphaerales bacterium]